MLRQRVVRKLAASFALFGVLLLVALPRAHAHLVAGGTSHHDQVVHRHFEEHHPPPAAAINRDHSGAVVWIDGPFTGPTSVRPIAPDVESLPEEPPSHTPQQQLQAGVPVVQVSVHDPPWATSLGLRAPPSLCLT